MEPGARTFCGSPGFRGFLGFDSGIETRRRLIRRYDRVIPPVPSRGRVFFLRSTSVRQYSLIVWRSPVALSHIGSGPGDPSGRTSYRGRLLSEREYNPLCIAVLPKQNLLAFVLALGDEVTNTDQPPDCLGD